MLNCLSIIDLEALSHVNFMGNEGWFLDQRSELCNCFASLIHHSCSADSEKKWSRCFIQFYFNLLFKVGLLSWSLTNPCEKYSQEFALKTSKKECQLWVVLKGNKVNCQSVTLLLPLTEVILHFVIDIVLWNYAWKLLSLVSNTSDDRSALP